MPDSASAAVAEPVAEPVVSPAAAAPASKPKRQPRYHVVLWNDDDHTFQYVISMLKQLFGHPPEKG